MATKFKAKAVSISKRKRATSYTLVIRPRKQSSPAPILREKRVRTKVVRFKARQNTR